MARRQYTSKERDTSFELDGVVFTPAAMSMLDLSDLARFADMDTATPAGIAKVDEFFRTILGGDYDRFRAHCAEHHTDMDTLMAIITDAFEDVLGVPTPRPSESTDGPPNTGPTLRVISSDGRMRTETLTPERVEELRAAVAQATG